MKFHYLQLISTSIFIAGLTGACHSKPEKKSEMVVQENGNKSYYGIIDKDTVYAYTLQNNKGLKAVISNYGGTILSLWAPDKSGNSGNVILGYDSLEGYRQKGNPYFGALVGRYANRIHHGSFQID